jgi:hypothetical protein
MTADHSREWRESLGAYALGHLSDDERAGIEAHLEGCPDCRAELESLAPVVRLLPLADPERLGTTPSLPRGLGDRIMASIAGERRQVKRRRFRLGFALSGATAAVAAAVLAIFVLPGGSVKGPAQHVTFASLPAKMQIGARLEPRPFGTEVHVYVSGVRSGELCRVFLKAKNGERLSAGSFRYRWGDNDSQATLSSGLDLARTEAIGIRVGNRTFVENVEGVQQS